MRVSKMLDGVAGLLHEKTGLEVLFDPQPVRQAVPHLRLTFMGAAIEDDAATLSFQVSIIGAGDGPDVFLPKVVGASVALARMFADRESVGFKYFEVEADGGKFRIYLQNSAESSGQFTRTNQDGDETTQWNYAFVEPHVLTVICKSSLLEGEKG